MVFYRIALKVSVAFFKEMLVREGVFWGDSANLLWRFEFGELVLYITTPGGIILR